MTPSCGRRTRAEVRGTTLIGRDVTCYVSPRRCQQHLDLRLCPHGQTWWWCTRDTSGLKALSMTPSCGRRTRAEVRGTTSIGRDVTCYVSPRRCQQHLDLRVCPHGQTWWWCTRDTSGLKGLSMTPSCGRRTRAWAPAQPFDGREPALSLSKGARATKWDGTRSFDSEAGCRAASSLRMTFAQ